MANLGCGCPGSMARVIEREETNNEASTAHVPSELRQWPVQLHLVPPTAPYFQNADILVSADCVAFAVADFNQRWLPGKKLAIACPKLDQGMESYRDKLVALVNEAQVKSISVMIMEVPCCGGLLRVAQDAVARAGRKVPIQTIVIGLDGEVRREAWA